MNLEIMNGHFMLPERVESSAAKNHVAGFRLGSYYPYTKFDTPDGVGFYWDLSLFDEGHEDQFGHWV